MNFPSFSHRQRAVRSLCGVVVLAVISLATLAQGAPPPNAGVDPCSVRPHNPILNIQNAEAAILAPAHCYTRKEI